MTWAKGTSGNLNGGKPRKLMKDALNIVLKETKEGNKVNNLRLVADALVKRAIEGDTAAIKEVFDRTDGKVKENVKFEGEIGHYRTLGDTELTHRILTFLERGRAARVIENDAPDHAALATDGERVGPDDNDPAAEGI